MKEMLSYCWKTVNVFVFIATPTLYTSDVFAQSCPLGRASLNAAPNHVGFSMSSKQCKKGEKESKRLTFTASGEESVSIESINLEPADSKSSRVFDIKASNAYYDFRPGDGGSWDVFFHPSSAENFSANVIVTFGYGNTSLGPYRQCIIDTYFAPVIRKRKVVAEVKAKGADLTIIDARETKIRSEYSQESSKLSKEKREADDKAIALRAEKKKVIEELKAGYYCSLCKDSKTQIESRGKETFEEHVKRVKGRIEPASHEQIENVTRDYDHKIEYEDGVASSLAKKISLADAKFATDLKNTQIMRWQTIEAFNVRIAELEKQCDEMQKRADEMMRVFEKKQQAREVLDVSVSGDCHAE